MTNLLTKLTMIRVPGLPMPTERVAEIAGRRTIVAAGSEPPASAPAPDSRISIFVNPQALTFPGAVVLVKGAWEGLKLTPLPGTATSWFPFLACLVIGAVIATNNLQNQKSKGPMLGLGLFVGLLNSLVMFAAVMGVSKT